MTKEQKTGGWWTRLWERFFQPPRPDPWFHCYHCQRLIDHELFGDGWRWISEETYLVYGRVCPGCDAKTQDPPSDTKEPEL